MPLGYWLEGDELSNAGWAGADVTVQPSEIIEGIMHTLVQRHPSLCA